ncbi:hypothetical protein QTG54_002214 [Skeletonema marinoi]|uniref:Uncharacterized protein n=1 Tax=Skeletonema marinoi TaxID=267567 RepID=A0AAD8YKQ9_9STRA|nr:hypothetical protein QTG54_002214 [Skeletonema marinoi]
MPTDIASPGNEKRRKLDNGSSSRACSHGNLSNFQMSFSNQHSLPLAPVPLISVPPPDGSFLSLHHHHAPHGPNYAHGPNNGPRWTCGYCNNKFNNWAECLDHEEKCTTKNDHGEKSCFTQFEVNNDRETYLLATSKDGEYLSERQCYIRKHFIEVFIANKTDVAARHSRGQQKLDEHQIGLRCVFCVKLMPRDRAARAICYPSCTSRIYQTVADMQRFHFEACSEIPATMMSTYKSLKTTRPRGTIAPQVYWDTSARDIGLVDSPNGIKVGQEDGMDLLMSQKKDANVVKEHEHEADAGILLKLKATDESPHTNESVINDIVDSVINDIVAV